jgi:hypothetical protein
MSATATQTPAPGVTQEQAAAAQERLAIEVVRPAFLHKLAHDWGLVPSNEADLHKLEEIAILAREHRDARQKQASHGNPVLNDVAGFLRASLQDSGLASSTQHEQMLHKAASVTAENNPEIEAAAAEYAAYMLQTAG